jgi:hypothetical protein
MEKKDEDIRDMIHLIKVGVKPKGWNMLDI